MNLSFLFAILFIILPLSAKADSWLPPKSFAHVSRNADIIVRVEPGSKNPDGSIGKSAHCRWYRFSEEKKTYEIWREHDLVNSTLPANVVVPDDGSFLVTFDDYMGIGTGENTVVVYDSAGRMLKRWTLKDIFSQAEIDGLPHSTMSIQWRGSVGVMMMKQYEVYIARPDSPFEGDKNKKFKGFMLDVKTLTIREDPRAE